MTLGVPWRTMRRRADPPTRAPRQAVARVIDDPPGCHRRANLQLRRQTLKYLLAGGRRIHRFADCLALFPPGISQLLPAGIRPRSAFLGTGQLTLAIRRASRNSAPTTRIMLSAECSRLPSLIAL